MYLKSFIPWIALILLLFIGGKMLIEGIKNDCEEKGPPSALGHCLFRELPLLLMRCLLVLLSQNITGSWLLLLP